MFIIAIDPGTKTGVTFVSIKNGSVKFVTNLWDLSTKKATKKHPAEPPHYRLKNLLENLLEINNPSLEVVVCENAEAFMRGKAAVKVAHELRGVIGAFCGFFGIELVMIDPNDLKQFATGKRKAEKHEMIAAANRMGYQGHEDNEADSYLIAKWYVENYVPPQSR